MEDCQKEAMTENREDVTREDEDRWCQKQVQVLNAIFRTVVGKISSPFLGDRVPAGVQEEDVFYNVPETVRQAVRMLSAQKPVQVFLLSVQYKFYVKHDYYIGDHQNLPSSRGPRPPENQCSTSPPPKQV